MSKIGKMKNLSAVKMDIYKALFYLQTICNNGESPPVHNLNSNLSKFVHSWKKQQSVNINRKGGP
jgi:hypothetical protein